MEDMGSYGRIERMSVEITQTEPIYRPLVKCILQNKSPTKKLNTIKNDGAKFIRFYFNPEKNSFKVSLRFKEPVTMRKAEIIFMEIYVKMEKILRKIDRKEIKWKQ